jgi:hypothetical protein
MTKTTILMGVALAALLSGWRTPARAGEKDICVNISDMSRGINCGSGDSVQVDVRNRCGVRVRGVVIFEQKTGDPIRQNIVLDSGDWLTAYACHGNGKVDKDFDPDR